MTTSYKTIIFLTTLVALSLLSSTIFTKLVVATSTNGTVSLAKEVERMQNRLARADEALEIAKKAFADSEQVKTAMYVLVKAGRVQADVAEAVIVSGDCGTFGCGYQVLVVKRYSTEGVNTKTDSIIAVVNVPAVGETTLKLVKLKELN
jgi:hypothetical protein